MIHAIVGKISTSQMKNLRDCLTEIQNRQRRNTLAKTNLSSVQLRPVVRKMQRDRVDELERWVLETVEREERRVLQIEPQFEVNIKIDLQIKC